MSDVESACKCETHWSDTDRLSEWLADTDSD